MGIFVYNLEFFEKLGEYITVLSECKFQNAYARIASFPGEMSVSLK